jgi:hypothetical protein
MAKEISELLKEATQGILTDETLGQIQSAFDTAVDERVKIHVEKALIEQDSDYTDKLQKLLEAIDYDHSAKLQKVVEALDTNNTNKLKAVINRYQKIIKENADEFKGNLISKVSNYIDIFIEDKIPQKAINEAVRNQKAIKLLSNLRESLSIDSALMNESVREGLIDGKRQIDEAKKIAEDSKKQLLVVTEGLEKTQANLVLESKISHLSDKKKAYAKRVLEGKSPKFIMENIDYTLSLFDKKEEERLETLKEQAMTSRTTKIDRPVVEESTETEELVSENTGVSSYLSELGRY